MAAIDIKTEEDAKQAAQPPVARRGVMDIQRPRGVAPVAPRPTPLAVAVKAEEQKSVPEPAPAAALMDSAPALTETPIAEPNPTPESVADHPAPAVIAPAAEQHSADHHDPHQQMLAAHATKKGKPVVVIVVAIIIALVMAGLTVFAFMKTKDSTKPAGDTTTKQAEPETTKTPAVTTTDVDDTSKAVDAAVTGDESTDIPASDLTDQSLGL